MKPVHCPFCGVLPNFDPVEEVYGTFYEYDCGCGLSHVSLQISDLMTIEERKGDDFNDHQYGIVYRERAMNEAIKRWNTRTPCYNTKLSGAIMMNKQQAKKLCLIKWQYAKDSGCDFWDLKDWLDDNHRKVFMFRSECAYCEKYMDFGSHECRRCPLQKNGQNCFYGESFYQKWSDAKTKVTRKKYASLLYDAIERS